jgi:hypothetical protein
LNGRVEEVEGPVDLQDVLYPLSSSGTRRDLRAEVADAVDRFDEFALQDKRGFVEHLLDAVAQARTGSLSRLTGGKGARPGAWELEILFKRIADIMERQGLEPTAVRTWVKAECSSRAHICALVRRSRRYPESGYRQT